MLIMPGPLEVATGVQSGTATQNWLICAQQPPARRNR